MPEVSFVIPAYNATPFLGEAIESVQRQSRPDWELIVVDDCSSDSTLEIARRYAASDKRIKVLHRDNPSGSAFRPRRDGILAASGKLIAPLDADDAIRKDYLDLLLQAREKSGADIVYALIWLLDGDSLSPLLPPDSYPIGTPIRGTDAIPLTLDGWKASCAGGLIPKDLYIEAFRRFGDTATDMNADETLTRQLLLLAPEVLFTSIPYIYRMHPASVTHEISLRRLDILRSCEDVSNLIRGNFSPESPAYILAQRQFYHTLLDCVNLLSDPRIDPESRREGYQIAESARRAIDFPSLKGHVSPILFALRSLPIPLLRRVLQMREWARKGIAGIRKRNLPSK